MSKNEKDKKEKTSSGIDRKHLAKVLFVDSNKSQKEVAERLGISASQVNRWVMAENWHVLKTANRVTSKQIALDLQKRIFEISQAVENDKRIITMQETDQISKLNACIRDLDKSADLPTYLQAFEEFLDFIRKHDEELFKTLPDFVYSFLTQKAVELSNG